MKGSSDSLRSQFIKVIIMPFSDDSCVSPHANRQARAVGQDSVFVFNILDVVHVDQDSLVDQEEFLGLLKFLGNLGECHTDPVILAAGVVNHEIMGIGLDAHDLFNREHDGLFAGGQRDASLDRHGGQKIVQDLWQHGLKIFLHDIGIRVDTKGVLHVIRAAGQENHVTSSVNFTEPSDGIDSGESLPIKIYVHDYHGVLACAVLQAVHKLLGSFK